ncbi:MAG: hypothetical protein JXR30_02420 [Alphaproteobacteria bacterium]|nr:hypothetical protein [Alphaproteobacteria bacterium]
MRNLAILLSFFVFTLVQGSDGFARVADRSEASARSGSRTSTRDRSSSRDNTSQSSSERRGRSVSGGGTQGRQRVAGSRTEAVVKKAVAEDIEPETEEAEESPSLSEMKKTVQYEKIGTDLADFISQAQSRHSKVGLGIKDYSMANGECISSYSDCASQASICGTNYKNCYDASPLEIEESTYFCFKSLLPKCHPDIHDQMFESLLKNIEMSQKEKIQGDRPVYQKQLGDCIRRECPDGNYPFESCYQSGLEEAKKACGDVISHCNLFYPDMLSEFENTYKVIREKALDEEAIYALACQNAGGFMSQGLCKKSYEIRYIKGNDFKSMKRVSKMNLSKESYELVLSENPTEYVCGMNTEAITELNNVAEKQSKRKFIATSVGGVAGAAVGAYFGAQFLPVGMGGLGGASKSRIDKVKASIDEAETEEEKIERQAKFDALEEKQASYIKNNKSYRKYAKKKGMREELIEESELDAILEEKSNVMPNKDIIKNYVDKFKDKNNDVNDVYNSCVSDLSEKTCNMLVEKLNVILSDNSTEIDIQEEITWDVEDFDLSSATEDNRDELLSEIDLYCDKFGDEKEACLVALGSALEDKILENSTD